MNKSELLKLLESVPDNLPIWLGVDSGEGYLPLDEVFVGNYLDLPLDGDDCSCQEYEYLSEYETPPTVDMLESGWILDDDVIGKPVIILGAYKSELEMKNAKFRRENKDKFRKDELNAELQAARMNVLAIERSLAILAKEG